MPSSITTPQSSNESWSASAAALDAVSVAFQASALAAQAATAAKLEVSCVARFRIYRSEFRNLRPIYEICEIERASKEQTLAKHSRQNLAEQQHLAVMANAGCTNGFAVRSVRKECARLTGVRHAFNRRCPTQPVRRSSQLQSQSVTEQDVRACPTCRRKYLRRRALLRKQLGRPLEKEERSAVFAKFAEKHLKHVSNKSNKAAKTSHKRRKHRVEHTQQVSNLRP